jgi:hypothetical protein
MQLIGGKMTKILYVYGEDYAALDFERLVEDGKLTAKQLWEHGTGELEIDDLRFDIQALEFGPVDPKFIDWVQSEQDHDESKHAQFYLVED